MAQVKLYDTTLRDGSQAEGISFQLEDKVRIAQRLDDLGVHYIEGGWPGSNPKDIAFFDQVRDVGLRQIKVAAFGSTRRAKTTAEHDANLQTLVKAAPDVATIFGKTWDFHVKEALRISLDENLELIYDSIRYLKEHLPEVVYDAEHFFDGYNANPEYALKTIQAAQEAGADCIVLCDTNGGTLPHQIPDIMSAVTGKVDTAIGIHAHNDSECAVANSLMCVEHGATHIQGTINGFGERCGNANLCSILPALQLKMGHEVVPEKQIEGLRVTSRYVYELANMVPQKHQPYVGNSAFAHKGGVHVSAIARHPETYEHIRPEQVGNVTRVLVSDLSGRSNILAKAEEWNIDLDSKDPIVMDILEQIKDLENKGFQFEGAEASFELMMRRALGTARQYFSIEGFRVIDYKDRDGDMPMSEATVQVKVGGQIEHTAAEGNGPVNALDQALRKALEKFYPQLGDMKLYDYKVRVLPAGEGTGSLIRVLIESGDHEGRWGTVGVSSNIIEASYHALVDALQYKLQRGAGGQVA